MKARLPSPFRTAAFAFAAGSVIYLAVLALFPALDGLPGRLAGFGSPWIAIPGVDLWFESTEHGQGAGPLGGAATILIVSAAIVSASVLGLKNHAAQRSGTAPISVTFGLSVATLVLALSAYASCYDGTHPPFITPLLWTAGVIKGSIEMRYLDGGQLCPEHLPVALDMARITALGALFVGLVSIAAALLQSTLDRIRIRFDSSITALIGPDEDVDSMVHAVAGTLEKDSRLVVITSAQDAQRRSDLRRAGHRVVAVDLDRPDALEQLPIWKHLVRLYLLASDPATNLQRLQVINRCMATSGKSRLPLIVRIDNPWQAESWRAQQLGGSDNRWAANVVGRYEITARRLLDYVVDNLRVSQIFVCGTTPLTLALCAKLLRRRLERKFYAAARDTPLPTLTIVGENAEEYRQDQEFHQQQRGITLATEWLRAVSRPPSVSCLAPMLTEKAGGTVPSTAVIFTEAAVDPMLGTRLAARFPELPIFEFSLTARETLEQSTVVGQLRSYNLTMEPPSGHSHDVWERAAMLIHNRYVAEVGHHSPATKPWDELDEFYRGSNRRQVRNALWMVEQIAGHTWDTFGGFPQPAPAGAGETGVFDRLRRMGFDRDAALAMTEAEHRDWCRYYRRAGWRYGSVRDDVAKIHDKLLPWEDIENNPDALNRALTSLAATLSALRELGYCSRPVWLPYRRTGTVTAEQRDTPFSWTSASGHLMKAKAGDWMVHSADGDCWSVRDDIFRSTYEHIGENRWRRVGVVRARPARDGEVVDTLEGSLTAASGDWVVRGARGELWAVPAEKFALQYEAPVAT